MRTAATLLAIVAYTILYAGCESWDKLVGEDDGSSSPPVAAPGPAPAPPPGAPTRFDLYRDSGGANTTDPQFEVRNFTGLPNVEIRPLADAGEGMEYLRLHTDLDGGLWYMTFDANNTGRTVDLSSYTVIAFKIRLIRPLVLGDQLDVTIVDGAGQTRTIALQTAAGFDPNSFEWQDVSVSLASLLGFDFSRVERPFGITVGNLGNTVHLDIDFDEVRWQ